MILAVGQVLLGIRKLRNSAEISTISKRKALRTAGFPTEPQNPRKATSRGQKEQNPTIRELQKTRLKNKDTEWWRVRQKKTDSRKH